MSIVEDVQRYASQRLPSRQNDLTEKELHDILFALVLDIAWSNSVKARESLVRASNGKLTEQKLNQLGLKSTKDGGPAWGRDDASKSEWRRALTKEALREPDGPLAMALSRLLNMKGSSRHTESVFAMMQQPIPPVQDASAAEGVAVFDANVAAIQADILNQDMLRTLAIEIGNCVKANYTPKNGESSLRAYAECINDAILKLGHAVFANIEAGVKSTQASSGLDLEKAPQFQSYIPQVSDTPPPPQPGRRAIGAGGAGTVYEDIPSSTFKSSFDAPKMNIDRAARARAFAKAFAELQKGAQR